jgi:hypothetical protein
MAHEQKKNPAKNIRIRNRDISTKYKYPCSKSKFVAESGVSNTFNTGLNGTSPARKMILKRNIKGLGFK